MAGGIDWFRWHHGSVTDPKFGVVAKRAAARVSDVIAVWAFLLEAASACSERGAIGPIDHEAIEHLFGLEEGQAARIVDAMEQRGLTADGRVASWEKRQAKRERDDPTAADRKRAQREREAEEAAAQVPHMGAISGDVTPCHTTSHQKSPREDKSRKEGKTNTPQPPTGGSQPISFKSWIAQIRAAGEKPIPEGDSVFEYCQTVGIPEEFLALHWEQFKAKHLASTKRQRDWRAHFRNSVRGNWGSLWTIRAEQPAALTTAGEQARREFEAHQSERGAA